MEKIAINLRNFRALKHLSLDFIKINNKYEIIEINEAYFKEIQDETNTFPEKELAMVIYELFSNKKLDSDLDMKELPKFVQKFINLCWTEVGAFYIPIDNLISSWKKQRISKRQKAVLYAIKNQMNAITYENLEKIGNGSSGEVYRMEDPTKAVKIIDLKSDIIYDSRIINEIRNLIIFKSQNVVKIYGVMVYDNKIGIIMEYLPKILANIIKNSESLTLKEIIDYCLQIAEAMKFIHSKNVIHRDLKPENIGFDQDGNIKLFDFDTCLFISLKHTRPVGTLLFMAPEQLIDEESDLSTKIDIFAYGFIMWMLFGGKMRIKSHFQLISDRNKGETPAIPSNVPRYLAKMILKCWSLKPEERPSFDEIVEILKSSMNDSEFKLDKFDWSNKEGTIEYNEKESNYKIFSFDQEKRIQIKNTLDSILLTGSNMKRVEDYCFKDDEILLIYSEIKNKPLNDILGLMSKDERLELVIDNIEFMITTIDMIHTKSLLHQRMDPATMTVTDQGMICFGDIFVPGIGDNSCDYIDHFDAPEIKDTHKHTIKSNIYSFTVLIAFILDGDSIFNEDGTVNINKVDRTYRRSIKVCLNSDPKKRPDFQTLYKIMFPSKYHCYSQCIDLANTRFSIFQTMRFQLDDIEIGELIGTGSSANVYLAKNKRTKAKIVVKECYIKGVNKLTFSPVYQELAALNVLKHPNLIKILGTITCRNSTVKILMEYANNGDLSSFMKSHKLSLKKFVEILVEVGLGMCFIHSRDVIHRDLKPENILISGNRAAVSDFNSAAFVSDRGTPIVFGKHGTDNYMAPEMMKNYPSSYSCDVFSFGMIICSYFKIDVQRLWNQILNNEKISLGFIEDLDLRLLAQRCLEFDSSRRPTFNFICRFLIKKFKINKFDKDCLYPSRRDLSVIEQMKNEIMVGNYEHAADYGRHLMYELKFEEAKKIFEKDSNKNNFAMLLYLEGKKSESVKYFKIAAEHNDVYALMVMGIMSENPMLFDLDTESNKDTALDYYHKAAQEDANNRCSHLENPKAKYLEGLVHRSNNNIQNAIECFYQSALEYDSDGLNMMGLLIESKLFEEEFTSPEDYFRMSASQLNPSGLFNLSRLLRDIDQEKSIYYEELSKLFGGSAVSEFRESADVLHESWDMHEQLCEIVRGLEVGSELGDRKCQRKLWKMITKGFGIHKGENCCENLSEKFPICFKFQSH